MGRKKTDGSGMGWGTPQSWALRAAPAVWVRTIISSWKGSQGSQLPLCVAHIPHAVCAPGVAASPVQDPTLGVDLPRIEEAEGSDL